MSAPCLVTFLLLAMLTGFAGVDAAELAPVREQLLLKDGWQVRQVDVMTLDVASLVPPPDGKDTNWLPVVMPAQIHETLLAHGRIPDPRIGHNCAQVTWVAESDWAYSTTFVTPQATMNKSVVFLRFDGVDTLATFYLNGYQVGRTRNMHRRHAFNVRLTLKQPGETNRLLVVFESPSRFLDQIREQFGPKAPIPPFKYFRKCESEFSGYLGHRPHFIKVGLFRDVVLDMPSVACFGDPWVRVSLSEDFSEARLTVRPDVTGGADRIRWTLLGPDGEPENSGDVSGFSREWTVSVRQPKLWWPHTHGTPHLYTLRLEVILNGLLLDTRDIRFGIREIEPVLKDPVTGENRFAFKINGQLIYLRGGCWAQLDNFTHVWDERRCEQILDLAVHGNMNVLRIWGEGVYPPEHFYDECDRRGLLVWQDFMTGHGLRFPLDYPGYREEMTAEATDVLKRLRNHPSLLLWVGGNEHYLGQPSRNPKNPTEPLGRELLEKIFPALVNEHDPGRHYHPSSPWGGASVDWPNGNYPLEGDWHDYATIRFMPGAAVPLFISEICEVSPPSETSLRRFMSEEDLWPAGFEFRVDEPGEIAWPPEWEYHSSSSAWEKIGRIEEFCEPRTAGDLVRVLGTGHGEYLQRTVERIRRGVPDGAPDGTRRCWGSTIWRFNDPWPMIYMSALDYYLEPKIAYYYLRRAYSPVLVSFEKTDDRVSVWVVNDSPKTVQGSLVVRRLEFGGKVVVQNAVDVSIQRGEAKRILNTDLMGEVPRRGEFYTAAFGDATATCFLAPERYLKLPKPELKVERTVGGVRVSSKTLAKQVSLEIPGVTGAVFEDNFFDLLPGQSRAIKVINPAGGKRVRATAVMAAAVEIDL